VRIFTPKTDVPFAGHPTIGTAAALARLGLVEVPGGATTIVFEEGVGPVAVDILLDGAATVTRLTLETDVETPSILPAREAVAAALSLPEDAVVGAWFAGVGIPFCFVHLADQGAVDRATLDHTAWSASFAHAWSPHLFMFAGDPRSDSRLYARMFAPAFGIAEDPVTGSVCAALVGVLAGRLPEREGTFAWRIDQGVAMGRPSLIEASAEKREGRTTTIKVGGSTVLVGEGSMTVPPGY